MLILSRVCADFYDRNRSRIHRITRDMVGLFHEAPESIREDPLFALLVEDGSIQMPENQAARKALEKEPFAGATAEGKTIRTQGSKPGMAAKAETDLKADAAPDAAPDPAPAGKAEAEDGKKAPKKA